MFNLSKHISKIAHLNLREEKHGEDTVLACDVKIEADVTNDFLSYLSPTLKGSLYEKLNDQGELLNDGHMPTLRYPALPDLLWDGTMEAEFIIHGEKKSGDMVFDASVTKLHLGCKEGGTVTITFRVSLHPTAEQSGRLAALLGQDAKVSVHPPEDSNDGDVA